MPIYPCKKCNHSFFVSNSVATGPQTITCPDCQATNKISHHTIYETILPRAIQALEPKEEDERDLQIELEVDKRYIYGDGIDFRDCSTETEIDHIGYYNPSWQDYGSMAEYERIKALETKADALLHKAGFATKKKKGHAPGVFIFKKMFPQAGAAPEREPDPLCKVCGKRKAMVGRFCYTCHRAYARENSARQRAAKRPVGLCSQKAHRALAAFSAAKNPVAAQ